jgi:protein TonB
MHRSTTCIRHRILIAALLIGCVAPLAADEKSEPPVPVRTVAPEIPVQFSRNGGSGLVTVSFMVDEKGQVQEASVEKSSHPDLNEPALKAIRKWRFKPAKKDGTPVAVRVSIPIKFEVES